MSTIHISSKKNEIAKIVLMPGDPLRAKFIAKKFLKKFYVINKIRNMLGYTGYYKNKKITVLGSGMGIPSIGIYSYELYSNFNVNLIIRIGSAGSYSKNINVNDIVLVKDAYSESSYASVAFNFKNKILKPSNKINKIIKKSCKKNKIKINEVRVYSTDVFYRNIEKKIFKKFKKKKIFCVEMESFGLFANAIFFKKLAASVLTISDSFITKKSLNSKKRENSFNKMIKLVLKTISKYDL